MQLVPIFRSHNIRDGGLYAIRYNQEDTDEFKRLFNLWADAEFVWDFCNERKEDLSIKPFGSGKISEVAEYIMDEARQLETTISDHVKMGLRRGRLNLDEIFTPLDNRVFKLESYQSSKTRYKTWFHKRTYLRIYAIRLAPNLYVVTGGAIKTVDKMKDCPLLQNELIKIERVKRWLKSLNIEDAEDL